VVLHHECLDSGSWERVLYDAHDGMEKLTIFCKIPPAASIAAPTQPPLAQPGCPASSRRRACDRRRKEAWAEKRQQEQSEQAQILHCSMMFTDLSSF
jgi:hypothetical protein